MAEHFLGVGAAEAVRDLLAGPNHTLPTSGTAARFGPERGDLFCATPSLISFNRRVWRWERPRAPPWYTLARQRGGCTAMRTVARFGSALRPDPAPPAGRR